MEAFLTQPVLTPWDVFVLRHRKPANLAIHAVSFAMFYGGPLAALGAGDWRWMGLFLGSGLVGAFGHWVTGDGGVSVKEASSSPLVVFYVTRMFLRMAQGRYGADIEAAVARHHEACKHVDDVV